MNESSKENTLKDLRNEFFNHILNWDPHWFWGKKYRNKIPNVINKIKMIAGQLHYNNVEEYQDVMFPQLIHEYWFTLQKDYEVFFKEKSRKTIEVSYTISSSRENVFSHFTSLFCCFGESKKECMHPRKGDLVEVFVNQNKYFAYVIDKSVCFLVHNRRQRLIELNYTLLLGISLTKSFFNNRSSLVTITSITFLDGCLAMVDALNYLETFPLCKLILSPNAEQYCMPSQLKLTLSDITTREHPNLSQLRVISGIIEAIELSKPKICLVQGPPGTGKSNTIVNLIASMIKRDNNIQFLVCAATNKSVDSLALQLMKIQPILKNQNIPFQVVRVGNKEKINEAVKDISLERLKNAEEREKLLTNSQVITSTLASCYTKNCMRENPFFKKLVCIVDEAAQANELLTMIPLLLGVKFLFLVGDHQQLEPIVLSQEAKRYGFNSSLFSRAQKIFKRGTINPIVTLDTQYRMVKSISHWPNKYFYNGRLKDAATVHSLGICNYMLFNHNFRQSDRGYANIQEAELVVKLILFLRKNLNLKKSDKITIGVITPYHEQRELIANLLCLKEKKFSRKSRNYESSDEKIIETTPISAELLKNLQLDFASNDYNDNDGDIMVHKKIEISEELFNNLRLDFGVEIENITTIEVNTVDSFQGSERDIIIMSCVRSHQLGFTKNPNRLNVSMTRAKHTLIMFGNFNAFAGNSMWSNMIQDATKRNVLVQVNNSNAESVFNQHVNSVQKQ